MRRCRSLLRFAVLAVPALGLVAAHAQGGAEPPAAPPPVFGRAGVPTSPQPRVFEQEYSHGDPTDEEQLLLALMNRARRDPVAEADRVYDDYGDQRVRQNVSYYIKKRKGVEYTREENRDAFRSYPARPPLAFNAKLIESARKHSTLGRQRDDQQHQYPGEPDTGQRIADEGYATHAYAESVFNYATNMVFAHAAFAIDWGQTVPAGESRPATKHRLALMDYDGQYSFVEVGVGVVSDTNPKTKVGPRLVTIDFGDPADDSRFVTGICYEDRNGNDFYDLGEGLPGVRIESPATSFFTVTSSSGGYALPVPAGAGTIDVTATGDPDGASAAVGVQTVQVTMAADNVGLDFTTAPDPPPPAAQTFTAAGGTSLAAAGRTEAPVSVPAFDATSGTVGDVAVALDLTHPDVSQTRVALVSPAGTEVVLFDHGPPLAGLAGEFDATLAPVGDLGAFVGEPYEGTWKLRVDDDASGDGREIASWSLTVRPSWLRALHAPRTNLALTTVKAVDSSKPAGDQVRVAGTLDASGRVLDASAPSHLRLLRDDGEEFARFDLGALTSSGQAKVKAGFGVKSTSKATFDVRLSKLDLPGPAPSPLAVELALGGAIARETVVLDARGGFNGKRALPAAPFFRVDSVRSTLVKAAKGKLLPGDRTTTVKGRMAGGPSSVQGLVEVFLGDFQGKISEGTLKRKGARVTATTPDAFQSFTYDPRTGVFQVKVAGGHDPLSGDVLPFALRIGTDAFGAADVKPRTAGTTLIY